MNPNKSISIFLPSRGRMDSLKESMNSIVCTAENPDKIEFLIKLDSDDNESINRINELTDISTNITYLISPQNKGYNDIHNFLNELAPLATGNLYFIWNDDALMTTHGWDTLLEPYKQQICIIQTNNNHQPHWGIGFEFPLIHKTVYNALGHFSLNPHSDTWLHHIAYICGIEIYLSEIMVIHERIEIEKNNTKLTYASTEESIQEFWSIDMIKERLEDIKTILQLIKDNGGIHLNE